MIYVGWFVVGLVCGVVIAEVVRAGVARAVRGYGVRRWKVAEEPAVEEPVADEDPLEVERGVRLVSFDPLRLEYDGEVYRRVHYSFHSEKTGREAGMERWFMLRDAADTFKFRHQLAREKRG